jgi:hypothetical protein
MRLRNTIIVIVLLALVGGYALYLGHQPAPEKTPKLFQIAAADIQQIELRSPTHDIVIDRAKGGGWAISKPVATAADPAAVDAVADAIANLLVADTAEDHPSDLAPFGLANPAVTVTVTMKDKRVLPAIMVGKNTPIGNQAFIKTADKPAVILVEAGFPTSVEKDLNALRSRALIGLKPDDVNRIEISRGNAGVSLEMERKGDHWTIVKPALYAADKAAVQQFLDAVTAAQATDFADDNPADLSKYGLASPSLTVELHGGKNNSEESLCFGFNVPQAYKNAIYVRRGQGNVRPVATVANTVFNIADKSLDDLRDKTVLTLDQSQVGRIVITGGPFDETLARAPGDKWSITTAGKTAAAEVPVAESLLDQLHDLKGTRIVANPMTNAGRFGMAHPNLQLYVYARDGKPIGTVRVSQIEETIPPPPGGAKSTTHHFGYAMGNASAAVYEVPPDKVTDLENTANRLRTTVTGKPTPAPAAAATPLAPAPTPSTRPQQ